MRSSAVPLQRVIQAAILGVAVALLSACGVGSDVRPPQVAVEDVRPVGGGLFSQQVRLDLRVTNPNDFDLDVTGLRANLDVNDQPFASGVSNQRVTIPRLDSRRVSLEATASTFDLARQVFNIGQVSDLTYKLDGTVFLAGFGQKSADFTQKGEFALRPQSGSQGNFLLPERARE